MRAALKHRDRVREIDFLGHGDAIDLFFKETNCAFPVLESLVLNFDHTQELPDTFLGGPVLSYLPLRRLKLSRVSLACVSRFLLSVTALTDLSLHIDTAFSPSPQKSLLACLQGMSCLRRLNLFIFSEPPSHPSTSKDITTLSKLTWFRYSGDTESLYPIVAGLSAPSLKDVDISFRVEPTVARLSRFIDEIEKHYHVLHVTTQGWSYHLSLLTQSEHINDHKPRFNLGAIRTNPPISIIGMSRLLSRRLTMVEELCVMLSDMGVSVWEDSFPWRRFLQQFPGVKTLRIQGANNCIARALLQDNEEPNDDLVILPALEEIVLDKVLKECERGPELAVFGPFFSARQQAGRPVKVSFRA